MQIGALGGVIRYGSSVSSGAGSAGSDQAESQSASVRPRIPFNLIPDITRRLSRSATIALLASPVGLIFIAVTRLLLISNYNISTALAVASSGGYVNTLLGSVLPVIPVLLPYLTLVLLLFNRTILGTLSLIATAIITPTALSGKTLALRQFAVDGGLFIAAAVFVIGLMLAIALLLAVVGIIRKFGGGAAMLPVLAIVVAARTLPRSIAIFACILLMPTVFALYPLPSKNSYYSELVRQPWLPDELITLASGRTIDGYVVSEDQDWVTILSDQDRRIYYYPPAQIKQRQVCQHPGDLVSAPLISLISAGAVAQSRLPQC